MGTVKKYTYYVVYVLAILLVILSALSLLYNRLGIWWLEILNFPRIQLLIASIVLFILLIILKRKWSYKVLIPLVLLLGTIVGQCTYVLPYTFISGNKVPSQLPKNVKTAGSVSLIISNVYMKNRQSDELIAVVDKKNPDMVLVMETDKWWQQALEKFRKTYPYHVEYPLENTYGMLLYSKYPLKESKTLILKHKNVPSIHAMVQLPGGGTFTFHGMHPVPPVPSKYPDNMGKKENELDILATMVNKEEKPILVAGDFNDVAWSYTSKLFQQKSRLRDVRIGRGFYNTFNAHSWFMRWPLDHIFVTDGFAVEELERLPKIGSDHFPIYVKLQVATDN